MSKKLGAALAIALAMAWAQAHSAPVTYKCPWRDWEERSPFVELHFGGRARIFGLGERRSPWR